MKTWKALQKLAPTFVSSPANSLWVNGYLMLIKLSLCSHPSYRRQRCTTLSNLVYLAWKQVQYHQMNFPSWEQEACDSASKVLSWSSRTLLTIVQSILLCNVRISTGLSSTQALTPIICEPALWFIKPQYMSTAMLLES
jgi:hypothetical protein